MLTAFLKGNVSVSRVLYPLSGGGGHVSKESGCPLSHAAYPGLVTARVTPGPLFGLAPGGVYSAPDVATRAVGSYPAFSPLPPRKMHRNIDES